MQFPLSKPLLRVPARRKLERPQGQERRLRERDMDAYRTIASSYPKLLPPSYDLWSESCAVRMRPILHAPEACAEGARLLEKLDAARAFGVVWNPNAARFSAPVPRDDALVVRLLEKLCLWDELWGRTLGDASLLFSAAGCERQGWHTDYAPAPPEQRPPASVLLALGPGTRIEFAAPRYTQAVPAGWACVFDGDVVHAGAAYDDDNVRLFAYLRTTQPDDGVARVYRAEGA